MILVSFCNLPESMSRTELIGRGAPVDLIPTRSIPDALRLAIQNKPDYRVISPGNRGPWILQNGTGTICLVEGNSETGTFCIQEPRSILEAILLEQQVRYWLDIVDQKNIRRTLTRQLEDLGFIATGIPGLWQADLQTWNTFLKQASWVPAQIYAWDAQPILVQKGKTT